MRLIFSTTPLEGHFRPLLPLARALAERGHEIVFATEAGWHPSVDAEGFAALPAGRSQREARAHLESFRGQIEALPAEERRPVVFAHLFAEGHARHKLPDLLALARAWRPDGIVWESADLAAPIVAAALGIPAVNHSFGVMNPLAALERAHRSVDQLWRAEVLEPEPYAGSFGGLYVDLSPASFAWEQPLGETVRLRPLPTATGSAPAWLDELEPPLVYITLGTVFNDPAVFSPLLDSLEGDVSALVTIGRNADPKRLEPLPPRVRVERFVPQAHVLPRCAAVVSHGGSGTTLGALGHALPLVLVPQGADQFDNAARAEAAGVAIVLRPGEVAAETVRTALRRVLDDPAFVDAARSVAAEIESMGTPEEVAVAVEEHVARG